LDSDDPVHGNQEQAFFNGHYDQVCYAPLFIFCGRHLLAANLRPSNVDPTEGALEELKRAKLHADDYCPRGEMENRIKEHQLDLFSDRTSTHAFESNQLRLWLPSFAYVLMQSLCINDCSNSPNLGSQIMDGVLTTLSVIQMPGCIHTLSLGCLEL
jgi:hypothetical protein